MHSIEIPTREGTEVVEVFLDELPANADEISDILLAEAAPLQLFHDFAVEYARRGNSTALEKLLRRGIQDTRDRKSGESVRAQARMRTTLAAHLIMGRAESQLEEATDLLNEAERRMPRDDDYLGLRKGK